MGQDEGMGGRRGFGSDGEEEGQMMPGPSRPSSEVYSRFDPSATLGCCGRIDDREGITIGKIGKI